MDQYTVTLTLVQLRHIRYALDQLEFNEDEILDSQKGADIHFETCSVFNQALQKAK